MAGHFGPEVRPLRFDAPSLWNVYELVTASASVDGTVHLTPNFGLSFGYEVLRLEERESDEVRHTHTMTFGVFAEFERGLKK